MSCALKKSEKFRLQERDYRGFGLLMLGWESVQGSREKRCFVLSRYMSYNKR